MRLLVILAVFGYLIWHIWLLMPLAVWGKWVVVALAVALLGLFILAMTPLIDRWPLGLATVAYNVGSTAMVIYLYSFLGFALVDLLRLVRLVPTAWVSHSVWGTAVWVVGLLLIGIVGGLRYHHKARVEIEVDGKGRVPCGTRIVAMSDLHIGYHNRRAELARWVDLIIAEHPDMVIVAGDIIDRSLRPVEEEQMHEEFHRLKAPVYVCLGNHEYYASETRAEQFYHRAGIHLLIDSVATEGTIDIIGRDDRSNAQRASLHQLMQRTDSSHFRLLLDHQPYHLEEAEQEGIDLQFSGHTHRGQLWPITWVVDAIYECAWGSYQRGATAYYVSSGLGIWGPKVRTGCQSEYVVITIRWEQLKPGRDL